MNFKYLSRTAPTSYRVPLQDWQRHSIRRCRRLPSSLKRSSKISNNRAFLAQVLIASVTATFVCHSFLGDNPAFVIPSIGHLSGILYLLVIPTAGLAALAGVVFQKGTLIWRDQIKRIKSIPFFLKPAVGAVINWILGIAVFFAIAKIGVFGLGYGDLETMFYGGISGPQAAVLSIAKLAATTAVYAWGGAGGIFAPTLFLGAAIGLAFTDLCVLRSASSDPDKSIDRNAQSHLCC